MTVNRTATTGAPAPRFSIGTGLGRAVRRGLGVAAMALLAGCASLGQGGGASQATPAMRWDGVPDGRLWTAETMAAIETHGAALLDVVPADIDTWCPGYREADAEGRALFWTGLISALSKHESTWNPRAVGGGGLWYGLVQIAPGTARGYGCEAKSGEALKDGVANLRCGVRIMASTVPRDGVVSAGMRGVAADWGPFHSDRKHQDMIDWVSSQPFCKAPQRSLFARL